jgi:hypothetical protein
MLRKKVRTLLLLLATVGISACASKTGVPGQGPPAREVCEGRRVLVVTNNTDVEMEIVESQLGSGGRTVIAIVGTGVREIPIRNDPEYSYSARQAGGRVTVAATSRSRVRDRAVTLSRECREG